MLPLGIEPRIPAYKTSVITISLYELLTGHASYPIQMKIKLKPKTKNKIKKLIKNYKKIKIQIILIFNTSEAFVFSPDPQDIL